MKSRIRVFPILVMVLICTQLILPPAVNASKSVDSRTIAIVFDNSGSMYYYGNKAWCRATYAMEVFASMLNTGDTLEIYPMCPITIGNVEYTYKKPFRITDAEQASAIRNIYTKKAGGTPIESIDYAVEGLKRAHASKKYLVVLTDGTEFHDERGCALTVDTTIRKLDERIRGALTVPSMTVMYLSIGTDACMPDTCESEYFVKRKAKDSADVLSTLTSMCNQIFGRDVLPGNRISGEKIEFDISMSKLIVFIQGKNISDLEITDERGKPAGRLLGTQSTKFSTVGSNETSEPDRSLQGMMVTYADCEAGSYTIKYKGVPTSTEVYYEPDVELDFVFTDAHGNSVDSKALYEGEYKVGFGMKDAKTGKLISSSLLGNPSYRGSYLVNGKKFPISHMGYSGEVAVSLKTNDTFSANLTVTYLSGYTITKNSSDFGWSSSGIRITERPMVDLQLEISVPQKYILISELGSSRPIVILLRKDGESLLPEDFDALRLEMDCGGIAYALTPDKQNSSYLLQLESTSGIAEGKYAISAKAFYTDQTGRTSQADDSGKITLSITPVWIKRTISFLSVLLLIVAIWLILHIKVLPRNVSADKNQCSTHLNAREQTPPVVSANIKKGTITVNSRYAGEKAELKMAVKPGNDSYLKNSQIRRSAVIKSIRSSGRLKITKVDINGVTQYEGNKLERKKENTGQIRLSEGTKIFYEGIMGSGVDKKRFDADITIHFK